MRDADSILSEIYEALDKGLAAHARELALQSLSEESADDPVLWYLAGIASLELSRFDEAVRAFEKSIEIDPGDVDAYTDLGLARFLDLQFDKASTAAELAAVIDPVSPDLLWLQGLLHDYAGRFDDANASYQAASKLDPERFMEPFRPDDDSFRDLQQEAIKNLAPEERSRLEMLALVLQPFPEEDWLRAQEIKPDPTLLGVREDLQITLFRRNLEREADNAEALCERILETLRHELDENGNE